MNLECDVNKTSLSLYFENEKEKLQMEKTL